MSRNDETGPGDGAIDRDVLDPGLSLFPLLWRRKAGRRGPGWMRQASCRAQILANARSLVAEAGYDHVAIRQIAARTGVTPPTVYNLVGSRLEVLHRATLETHTAKVAFAEARAEAERVNVLLAYADTLWIGLSQHPQYSRALIDAIVVPQSDHELPRLISDAASRIVLAWLTAMHGRGEIVRTVDLPAVASAIRHHVQASVFAWAHDEVEIERLRHDMLHGVALILLGLVDRDTAAGIETWLAAQAAGPPQPPAQAAIEAAG